MAKGAKKEAKAKGPAKNKLTSKKYAKYKVEGDTVKAAQTCPKCGPAMFLGLHKDRKHCGKCGYTEFVKS